jgi:hypothetical protein
VIRSRTCADCGIPVSGRRRLCPACKADRHAARERDRRAAEKEQRLPHQAPWQVDAHELGSDGIVDYSSHGIVRPAPKDFMVTQYSAAARKAAQEEARRRLTDVVDYSAGGDPRPSIYERQPPKRRRNEPASRRHDYSQHQRDELIREREEELAGENETTTWSDVEARVQNPGQPRIVAFHAPAHAELPPYDLLGRSLHGYRG